MNRRLFFVALATSLIVPAVPERVYSFLWENIAARLPAPALGSILRVSDIPIGRVVSYDPDTMTAIVMLTPCEWSPHVECAFTVGDQS